MTTRRRVLLPLTDLGPHRHGPAGERLADVEAAELAKPALRNHCVGRFRRNEITVGRATCRRG